MEGIVMQHVTLKTLNMKNHSTLNERWSCYFGECD